MPGTKKLFDVSATREYRPFGQLMHAARCLGEIAEGKTAGSGWAGVGGLVMLAFGVEAFCQEFGQQLFPSTWASTPAKKGLERKAVLDKLKMIGRELDVAVDYGKHPWLDIKLLMGVRDSLAHPKPLEDRITVQLLLDEDDTSSVYGTNLLPRPWELMAEAGRAAKVQASVRSGLELLLTAAGKDKWEMETMGSGSYTMALATEQR